MNVGDERVRQAAERTEILRTPKRALSTFGTTNVYYYLLTEPAYSEIVGYVPETVIREGRVIAEKPKIVTPYYLSNVEGFGEGAQKYLEMLTRIYGPSAPGLLYAYRNEHKELNIVSENLPDIADKLNRQADSKGDPMVAIIRGTDELWDVSLMKFIYELTRKSAEVNSLQLGSRGLFNMDAEGVPAGARARIEELFNRVASGAGDPSELKLELDRWGVFEQYEDRFFRLFKKK